jgi:hypothetical protein
MIRRAVSAAAAAIVLLGSGSQVSLADSSDAMCEVRKDGDMKKGASGPCTFSQRQGYIDVDLRNGDTYSLAPGNKSGHYKDQKGNKVVRTMGAGGTQEFKWEGGKKIIVTYSSTPAASAPTHGSSASGGTPPDLADLVGAKGGQAEGELERRGYVYAKGSTSGNAKYSSWWNATKGQCVMIRTEEGRYQSIVSTLPFDCGH